MRLQSHRAVPWLALVPHSNIIYTRTPGLRSAPHPVVGGLCKQQETQLDAVKSYTCHVPTQYYPRVSCKYAHMHVCTHVHASDVHVHLCRHGRVQTWATASEHSRPTVGDELCEELVFVVGDVRELWPFLVALVVSLLQLHDKNLSYQHPRSAVGDELCEEQEAQLDAVEGSHHAGFQLGLVCDGVVPHLCMLYGV